MDRNPADSSPPRAGHGLVRTMTLRDKLEEDIRNAMRQREQPRVDALRFLKFAVQAVEKERRETLDDPAMVEVASKQVSDRRDSIKAFREGGRTELADKEAFELTVLEEYLPPQLSEDEIVGLIREVVGGGGRRWSPRPRQGHGPPDAPGARQGRRRRGQPPRRRDTRRAGVEAPLAPGWEPFRNFEDVGHAPHSLSSGSRGNLSHNLLEGKPETQLLFLPRQGARPHPNPPPEGEGICHTPSQRYQA